MDKETFIAAYCQRSNVTWDFLSRHSMAVPCACGEEGCAGWAMVRRPWPDDDPRAKAWYAERDALAAEIEEMQAKCKQSP